MTAALPPEANLQILFQDILDRVLNDDLRLPSMPDIAIDVRVAISEDNTTCESLTAIIAKDPALTAYLVKAASSPIYRRPVPPKTLADVVGLLGFAATSSLVMIHSTRNMVELNSPIAKELFEHTWERLVVKTSVASFLAQQLKYRPVEQVQMAMLLSEVGSLSVLSAMMEASEEPDTEVYFQMCRQYSKRLGSAALTKWGIDSTIVDLVNDCGQWDLSWNEDLNLLDIANLALYATVQLTSEEPTLPDIDTLAAFAKLPEELRACSKKNWLDVIVDNDEEIQTIISAFK
ncbi:MAG: HDOD domain-containing protein [Pseudomonadota bacterium]